MSDEESDRVEAALGRKDPIDFWIDESMRHCMLSGVPSHLPVESISVIKSAVGELWLNSELSKAKRSGVALAYKPNLCSLLTTPGKANVLRALEIARSIKTFSKIPGVDDVLQMLKQPAQFESTLLQLLYAFRFKISGANILCFEPTSEGGGRADILLGYRGQKYVVECYVPQNTSLLGYEGLWEFSAKKILKQAEATGKRFIVKLILRQREVEVPLRRDIENSANEIIRSHPEGALVSRVDKPNYSLELYQTTQFADDDELKLYDQLASDIQWGVNGHSILVSDSIKIVRGQSDEVSKTCLSRFMCVVPQSEWNVESEILKIASKAEGKIRQLRHNSEPAKGILVVGSYYGRPDDPEHVAKLRVFQSKLIAKHKNLEAVLVADDVRDDNGVPYYSGTLIQRQPRDLVLDSLFDEMNKLEADRFVLRHW
jgi:hypothetical protein